MGIYLKIFTNVRIYRGTARNGRERHTSANDAEQESQWREKRDSPQAVPIHDPVEGVAF